MGHMEVITRVERRRRYSDEERAAVLTQCDKPGATVVGVSRRLGISASLIHGWRKTRREAERIASARCNSFPTAWSRTLFRLNRSWRSPRQRRSSASPLRLFARPRRSRTTWSARIQGAARVA